MSKTPPHSLPCSTFAVDSQSCHFAESFVSSVCVHLLWNTKQLPTAQ